MFRDLIAEFLTKDPMIKQLRDAWDLLDNAVPAPGVNHDEWMTNRLYCMAFTAEALMHHMGFTNRMSEEMADSGVHPDQRRYDGTGDYL